mmetsp:Transcript_4259/g.11034  ORF Transcript_4259/g.11034 Transcript_4259/m.11034 type:complete len:351 (-) Transcript_4259:173-1225(-)
MLCCVTPSHRGFFASHVRFDAILSDGPDGRELRVSDSPLLPDGRPPEVQLDAPEVHVDDVLHLVVPRVEVDVRVVGPELAIEGLKDGPEDLGTGKLPDRVLQVEVFLPRAAEDPPHERHDVADEHPGGDTQVTPGLVRGIGKLEDGQDPVGLQQLVDLAQRLRSVRYDVPDPEGHGRGVESLGNFGGPVVVPGQIPGVGRFKHDGLGEPLGGDLGAPHGQHVLRRIQSQHRRRMRPREIADQLEGDVGGSRRHIQDLPPFFAAGLGIPRQQLVADPMRHRPPPPDVHIHGQHPVDQIVPGGDLVEHVPRPVVESRNRVGPGRCGQPEAAHHSDHRERNHREEPPARRGRG